MSDAPHVPYRPHDPGRASEIVSHEFYTLMNHRRSVRHFSNRAVSRETIENIVRTAGTAPSGANRQPWRFVCVDDAALKREIREAAEAEEHLFYTKRASEKWLHDLEPFATTEQKPFLEIAPWLIVVFELTRGDDGGAVYYASESTGIATGILLAAIQVAGLCALTHSPAPMRFLSPILRRPANERPFLLIPVGHAADGCEVPDIHRKPLEEIMVVNR
ncbi:nitroreductase family protein [bacterium]|nr:nitroreductase family protein [bacterium]